MVEQQLSGAFLKRFRKRSVLSHIKFSDQIVQTHSTTRSTTINFESNTISANILHVEQNIPHYAHSWPRTRCQKLCALHVRCVSATLNLDPKTYLSVYNSNFRMKFSDLPPFQEFIYIFPNNNRYYGTSTVLKNFESTAVGNAAY